MGQVGPNSGLYGHMWFFWYCARFQGILAAKPFPGAQGRWLPAMLEELEQQETTQEQLVVPRLEIAPPAPILIENDQRQRRRMVIALVMLLVALGLVLIKDRDFWFSAPEATESEAIDDSAPATADETRQPAVTTDASATPVAPASRKRHAVPVAATKAPEPAPATAPAVSASRGVLHWRSSAPRRWVDRSAFVPSDDEDGSPRRTGVRAVRRPPTTSRHARSPRQRAAEASRPFTRFHHEVSGTFDDCSMRRARRVVPIDARWRATPVALAVACKRHGR